MLPPLKKSNKQNAATNTGKKKLKKIYNPDVRITLNKIFIMLEIKLVSISDTKPLCSQGEIGHSVDKNSRIRFEQSQVKQTIVLFAQPIFYSI